jgi:Flp pilus assembly protein TadD
MMRFGRLTLALALLMVVPSVASAQRDTRYTREASKYLGLAMARQDEAGKQQMYEQAMVHLREGMQRDADNARVWLLAGTVLAGMGEMAEADQAFVRALQLHPAYADDIESEREQAWIDAFNTGIELMDQQRYDEAIRLLENAQLIYRQRPEALMNLGAMYANTGQTEQALRAFEQAADATRSPLFDQLDAEQQDAWTRMRDMAQLNIAQISAAAGVDAFQEDNFAQAEAHFQRAMEINPHSRDYLYNYAQALWAQASGMEDVVEAEGPGAAEARQQLPALYTRIEEAADKLRVIDPNNETMYIIAARAKRMRGLLEGDEPAGQQAALRLLEQHDALPVLVEDVQVHVDGDAVAISGRMKNRKATAGAPVQIQFTLLGADGRTVGQETITVNAPAADADEVFRARVASEGELAGWRYTVQN